MDFDSSVKTNGKSIEKGNSNNNDGSSSSNFKLDLENLNQQFNQFLVSELSYKPYADVRPIFLEYQVRLMKLCRKHKVKNPEPTQQFITRNSQVNGELPDKYKYKPAPVEEGGFNVLDVGKRGFKHDFSAPIPNPFGNLNKTKPGFNGFNLTASGADSIFGNTGNGLANQSERFKSNTKLGDSKNSGFLFNLNTKDNASLNFGFNNNINKGSTTSNKSTNSTFSDFGSMPLTDVPSIFSNQLLTNDFKSGFGSQPLNTKTSLLLPNQPIMFGQVSTNLPAFNSSENPFKPFSSNDGDKLMTPAFGKPFEIPPKETNPTTNGNPNNTNKFGAGFNQFVNPSFYVAKPTNTDNSTTSNPPNITPENLDPNNSLDELVSNINRLNSSTPNSNKRSNHTGLDTASDNSSGNEEDLDSLAKQVAFANLISNTQPSQSTTHNNNAPNASSSTDSAKINPAFGVKVITKLKDKLTGNTNKLKDKLTGNTNKLKDKLTNTTSKLKDSPTTSISVDNKGNVQVQNIADIDD